MTMQTDKGALLGLKECIQTGNLSCTIAENPLEVVATSNKGGRGCRIKAGELKVAGHTAMQLVCLLNLPVLYQLDKASALLASS